MTPRGLTKSRLVFALLGIVWLTKKLALPKSDLFDTMGTMQSSLFRVVITGNPLTAREQFIEAVKPLTPEDQALLLREWDNADWS